MDRRPDRSFAVRTARRLSPLSLAALLIVGSGTGIAEGGQTTGQSTTGQTTGTTAQPTTGTTTQPTTGTTAQTTTGQTTGTTVGDPNGEPVVVVHGTTGSASSMLTPGFAGELFGPGQPLDAAKYYIIIPDVLGHGKSSKPSDGLRTKFPRYNYDDMVEAQYRLLKEHLGLNHVRVIIGNSMGGMHAWIWGVKHPAYMDALVPMASQPSEMASRNWMMRRLLVETIRRIIQLRLAISLGCDAMGT
ncbi:alpha/beta fold hydrolase, partial [bacterium]